MADKGKVYRELFFYIFIYIIYYCILASVLEGYGVGVSAITALSMILAVNSVRKKENKRYGIGIREALGVNIVKLGFKEFCVLILLGLSLNFIAGGIINLLPAALSQGYSENTAYVLRGNTISTVVFIAVITPLLEEVFFRGIIQRKLAYCLGDYRGLVAAALVFGLMHFNIIWSIYTAVIGFFIGAIYIYYGSVLPGALVHCVFNLVSCVPLIAMKYEKLYRYTFGSKAYVVLTLVLGFIILYFVFEKTWLKRYIADTVYAFKPTTAVNGEETEGDDNDKNQ